MLSNVDSFQHFYQPATHGFATTGRIQNGHGHNLNHVIIRRKTGMSANDQSWSCDEDDCSVLIDPADGKVEGSTVTDGGVGSPKDSDQTDEEIISRLLQEAKWNGNWDGDVWEPDECKLVWKNDTDYDLVCKGDLNKLEEGKELLSEADQKRVVTGE